MSEAWEIRVRGLVQGVGFRPHTWRLARAAGLAGEVLNDGGGVLIRLACTRAAAEGFARDLQRSAPPLARIDRVETRPFSGDLAAGFRIVASAQGEVKTGIIPDAATCPDCVAEIFEAQNRRFGYPFTNCTNCGPRLSITRAIPYDRAQTSMAVFAMCPACQREYDDPRDRRYHAQPNACPDCGPRLTLVDASGASPRGEALKNAVRMLQQGKIVAIKGLGGFQLALDAQNEAAIAALRTRKNRPAKPLALMMRDTEMAARFVHLDPTARQWLQSWPAPIVLAPVRAGATLAPSVAPGQNRLGVMLANTALHHLLLRKFGRPIVLTSGNASHEPQITDNDQALQYLSRIADFWLLHNRDIVNRTDDSVVQIVAGAPQIMRRARGYSPAPLALHEGFADAPPVLAAGADIKNTFCLLKDGQAVVSQHMGDMQNPKTQRDYAANIDLYQGIYGFTPAVIALDLHPGYFSTRLGQARASAAGIEPVYVQHHHAHIAATLGEHGFGPSAAPVLGVVLDGLGQGADNTLWGGEFLLAGFTAYRRVAYFAPVALPGGDKANTQPWRNLVAHVFAAFGPNVPQVLLTRYGPLPAIAALRDKPCAMIEQMIKKGINSPMASSCARLFDAVAAVLGICFEQIGFEGQAAMQLQALAEACPNETGFYALEVQKIIVWRSLWEGIWRDLQAGTPPEIIARRFHNSLTRLIAHTAVKLAGTHHVETVVLTGGVFQNGLLLSGVTKELERHKLRVLCPSMFPANDGGISLGQSVIAASIAVTAAPPAVQVTKRSST